MLQGGNKKIQKTIKTKFRKNTDKENNHFNKQKHHDKSFYRLAKEEKDYVV
jgi:hypothetical protein